MEEVIDCINAASSPEELAINFLLRHARCRIELTGWILENQPDRELADAQAETAADQRQATCLPRPRENRVADVATVSAVTAEDSCAARFSRAYVAARHMSASRRTMTTTGKAAA